MSESFVLSENLNKVLGYGEESLVFLRMFYAVKEILPEVIIRGTNEDLIGVSLPEKRFIFYVLKKGEITSVKFKSSKAIDFTVDNTSLLIQLAVDEAHRVIEQPEAYLIHQPKQQKIEGQISTIVETVSTIDHNSQGQASDVITPNVSASTPNSRAETHPRANEFPVGTKVIHKRFGEGVVEANNGRILSVRFADIGLKAFSLEIVLEKQIIELT